MGRPANWTEKRVLISGATGFIGRYLTRQLVRMEAKVYAGTSPTGDPLEPLAHPAPRIASFDIRDSEAVRAVLDQAKPDVVFHLAAVGVTNPRVEPLKALMVNAGGAINLLEALRGSDVDRVVLAGTSYEYGSECPCSSSSKTLDPLNAYAASKVAAWAFGRMYWHAYDLPVVIVRPFQVYGPGQPDHMLIPSALRAALSGEDFLMTPGEQKRDFVFAEDVADGMIAAAGAARIEGASLDLGTGIGTTVRNVVEQIWGLAATGGSIRPGALPYRAGAALHLVADADRTARLTGWRATTPLDRGLRATMTRMRTHHERHDDV